MNDNKYQLYALYGEETGVGEAEKELSESVYKIKQMLKVLKKFLT